MIKFVKPPGSRFDGFDDQLAWQMLPLRGSATEPVQTRDVALDVSRSTGGALTLSFNDPSVAEFTEVAPSPHPGLRVFRLEGKKVGRAMFEARDGAGKVAAFLQVAVKPRLVKKVAILRVKDATRETRRSGADLDALFQKTQPIFSAQANIAIEQVGPITPVTLTRPLGKRVEAADFFKAALEPTPNWALRADVLVYFVWDFDAGIAGVEMIGKLCAVEDGAKEKEALVLGHEIGHAMGLKHNIRSRNQLMYDDDSIVAGRLDQSEIDLINPT